MSLQFIFGNSGSGKTTYLYSSIVEEAAENPFKNYLVIVPEQFTLQTQRMLVDLSKNHAIMNIDVLSFKRLAYRIFDELGINNIDILEETGKNLVLRKIAQEREDRLSVLRPNMNRIGYISEVKSLLSEFVQYNITPAALNAYINSDRISEVLRAKLKDVLVMYEGFEEFMSGRYITAEELLNVLSRVAHESSIIRDSVLVFDEFTGFTPIQNQLLKELLPIVDRIYVTLTIDSKEDFFHSRGMHELFDMPKKAVSSLCRMADELGIEVLEPVILSPSGEKRYKASKELYFMEQNLFRRKSGKYEDECENISITGVKTPSDEVIYVAREINKLVRTNGLRYKDIAIVSGDDETYSNYIAEIFGRYEIPYFLDTTKEIIFHPFIEFIRATCEVILRDFSYESVFRFLRCGYAGIEEKQVDILENYVLALGLRGYKNWANRWIRLPKEKSQYELEELEGLREKIFDILDPVYNVFKDKDSTIKDRIVAIYTMIDSLGIEEQLWKKEQDYLSRGDQVKSKEYGQIFGIVISLMEKYVAILGDEVVGIMEFIEILDAGFDAAEIATIPPGYDCVTIGDIERTRLNNIKVLFFIGVNDGIIPKAATQGGIISQYEREVLKEMDIELAPGAREQSFIQKFYLYLNMTKPSDKLIITYHRLDKEGKGSQKSYLIATLERMFPKMEITSIEDISQELDVSTKGSAKEYLLHGNQDDNWFALAKYFGADDYLEARYQFYEGNPISKNVARAIYGRELSGSVTRLEQFARCEYAHFLKYGLYLKEREQSGFENVDIGIIYHEALLQYSRGVESSEYDWRSIPDENRLELCKQSMAEALERHPTINAYATAQENHTLQRMEHVFEQTVWALTEQIKKGRFSPLKYEFKFDIERDDNISLEGQIDRIDVCHEDGKYYVKIIDYKSGNAKFDLLKLYNGVQLQLVVYMNAAIDKAVAKSDAQIIPGGMLYYHINDPVLELADAGDTSDIEESLLTALRPEGLVNENQDIVRAFDEEFEKKSQVIPVTLKKDGSPDSRSSVATTEQFEIMREFVNTKISQIASDIYAGEIKVNPLNGDVIDSCKFCQYQTICGINSKLPGYGTKTGDILPKDEIYDRMATENAIYKSKKGD